MGWIHKRHMENGGSIGGNASKTREAARYPLRDIVAILRWSDNMFAPNRVLFSCGHEGTAWGDSRGRCRECPPKDAPA